MDLSLLLPNNEKVSFKRVTAELEQHGLKIRRDYN